MVTRSTVASTSASVWAAECETSLELGKSDVDAPLEKGLEVTGIGRGVGLLDLGQGFHRAGVEESGEH